MSEMRTPDGGTVALTITPSGRSMRLRVDSWAGKPQTVFLMQHHLRDLAQRCLDAATELDESHKRIAAQADN